MIAGESAERGILAALPPSWTRSRLAPIAAPLGLAALIGLVIALGGGPVLLVLLTVIASVVIGLTRWRWATYLFIAYMPVAGIAALATYPNTAVAVNLKDVLFVAPAYLGFIVAVARHRQDLQLGRLPIRWVILYLVVIALQFVHAWFRYPLVAVVGLKIYLFYLPMYVIGFHLVTDRRSLTRLLSLFCVVAIPPTVVGLAEALLLYGGHRDIVYAQYGAAAVAATQDFASFQFTSGMPLLRIPSTFAFVSQYFYFEATMIAIGYAWWRWLVASRSRWRRVGLVVWALFALAAASSGQRSVFLLVPLLVGLIVLLDVSVGSVTIGFGLAMASIIAMTQVLGIDLMDAASASAQLGFSEFTTYFVDYIPRILSSDWVGSGLGIFTVQAGRYAGITDLPFYEPWFIKLLAELGMIGLVTFGAVLGALLFRGLSAHVSLRRGPWRSTSAALLALILWTTIYGTKSSPLDIDPLNAYFWLYAGILARVGFIGLPLKPSPAPHVSSVTRQPG